jgi:hypothetical protein
MINKRYSIISLSKMIRDDDDEMRGDHFHDDDIRQHEHNVYHGYATWYPSSGPLYNISDYNVYDIQVTSNAYHQICFMKSVWFIVAYFLINRY